jgi:hypothetical protein
MKTEMSKTQLQLIQDVVVVIIGLSWALVGATVGPLHPYPNHQDHK